MKKMAKGLTRQKGVVLFFALIILIMMTVIGVALAVNSTQSLRMAGAGAERVEAKAIANGALDAVINKHKGAGLANMSVVTSGDELGQIQTLIPMPKDGTIQDVSCQRSSKASGANLISCRRLEVQSNVTFGRDDLGQLRVVAGIEQEVLSGV
ncbi:pilus assembly PilX family protein [Shewanella marisflavi]|uniref:pilus assembly PilX family protein n=1 Tax=Shewanella marisflavi TaxID=260364 RepID=UPI003AAD48EB